MAYQANIPEIKFSWYQVIEHGTVLETCAIDALLIVVAKDGDFWTYATDDIHAWVDFKKYQNARSRRIKKEFIDRYS